MKKTKLALATSAVVGLSSVAYQGARAGSATTNATADLVKDIVVTKVQHMAFGNLLADFSGTAATKETVKFNTAGTDLQGGANVTHVDGAVQPAKFNLSTDADAASGQNITVKATALSNTADSSTLPWRSLKADYNATASVSNNQATGTGLTVNIKSATVPTGAGATLEAYGGIEVESADTAGSYSGIVTVTAIRQ